MRALEVFSMSPRGHKDIEAQQFIIPDTTQADITPVDMMATPAFFSGLSTPMEAP